MVNDDNWQTYLPKCGWLYIVLSHIQVIGNYANISTNINILHMNEFLEKLYDKNIDVSSLLLEAKKYTDEINDPELTEFIEKELNGYKIEDGIPKYREIRAQIVADIKDIYGQQTHTEYPIDFSLLSDKVGFDLDTAYIPDGVSFVELSINGLSGKNAIKPIPTPIVKMLDEIFHFNNKTLHLINAYHKIPTATLEYVLIKVRQILIDKFQEAIKLKRNEKKQTPELSVENIDLENQNEPIKVFVAYAWEDTEHNEKVISFVNFLRNKGFDASMDRKESQQSSSVNFNQLMIGGIQNSDKVIIVLSKKYKEKSDNFEGGVWQELSMILEEKKTKPNKYIFVTFGKDEREAITPTAILGFDILDLKKDQDDNDFNTLFAKIKEENIIIFSDVNKEVIDVKKAEIKPFKL